MKIYLDNCCFNRPYDDQGQLSVFLETQAKLQIQEGVRNKAIVLIWSDMLDYENSANPDDVIRVEIAGWRNLASQVVTQTEEIRDMAKNLNSLGFGRKDSLHISCAIYGKSDYFVTVDKGILRKQDLVDKVRIISTIEMIRILEGENEN